MHRVVYEEEYKVTAQPNHKTQRYFTHLLKISKYKKSQETQYETEAVELEVRNGGDLYAFASILRTVEIAYCLLNTLSQPIGAQKELLVTGCYLLGIAGWQLKLTSKHASLLQPFFSLDYLNALGILTFRHLAAFTVQISTEATEPLHTFGRVLQTLLSDYVLRVLLQDVEVVAHRIKEKNVKSALESAALTMDKLEKDIENPECLWNESTRAEFRNAVKAQYEYYHKEEQADESSFASILGALEYSAYKEEIKVGGVFIRLINKDPYMKFANPTGAMKSILKALAKASDGDLETTKALVEALHNIVMYHKGRELGRIEREDVKTLCDFVDPTAEETPREVATMWDHVLTVLVELTKDHKQTINLIQCRGFVKLAFYQLVHRRNVDMQNVVMHCMENIISQPECDAEIISNGFLLVFLGNGINRAVDRVYRSAQFRYAQQILARNPPQRIAELAMIVPRVLLEQFAEKNYRTAGEWIDYLDGERQEICYMWDTALYECVMKGFREETQRTELKVMADASAAWETPKQSYISAQFNKGEIVVGDVVISMFVRNPYVKIRVLWCLMCRNRMSASSMHCATKYSSAAELCWPISLKTWKKPKKTTKN